MEVTVKCLWRETRSDWLLGSTLRMGSETEVSHEDGIKVMRLGMNRGPGDFLWAGAYYFLRLPAARHFARRLEFPPIAGDLVHVIRLGREHLGMRAFMESRRTGQGVAITPNHHPRWSTRPDPAWRWMYRNSDVVFALTQVEGKALEALGVSGDRIAVTGIGPVLSEANMSRTDFLSSFGLPDLRFIGFVGQQFPYKRIDLVVQVFDQLARHDKDLGLLIAGPPTDLTRTLVDRSENKARIYILGAVSTEHKTAMLHEIEVLLFPSEQESFGGVLVEAAWVGTPFVTSDISVLRETTERVGLGVTSRLEVTEFADRVRSYLDNPPTEKDRSLVRAQTEKRFSWTALARQYVHHYQAIL